MLSASYLLRMIEVIKTERLILRPMTGSDAPAFYRFYSDPLTMRYIGDGKVVESQEKTLQSIEKHQLTHYQKHGFGLWAVTLVGCGTVIGHCGTLFWDIDEVREYEIAYLLGREYWGMGYATEAACATRDWGFGVRKFSRMVSLIYPDNVSSQRVAERVGMFYEKNVTIMENVEVRMYAIENPNPNSSPAV